MRRTFLLADVLEYSPKGHDSAVTWDLEGWHGGDYNRIWLKSEGTHSALRTDYDVDIQVLYGRFVRRYYDFQIGGRMQTKSTRDGNETRPQGVLGLEGLVPYRYEVETALFISDEGDLSGRATATKDLLITQRLVLQARLETNFAAQRVERFTIDSGLNNIDVGLRLRYEIRREFAPYVGVSFERSFFGTADLVRREGSDPSELGVVVGVRLWR